MIVHLFRVPTVLLKVANRKDTKEDTKCELNEQLVLV